jgi:serine O-acetyltransferase
VVWAEVRSRVEADLGRALTARQLAAAYLIHPAASASVLLRLSDALLARRRVRLSRLVRARLANKHGVHFGEGSRIGEALRMHRPVGIVVGAGVRIGDGVHLYQGVTLGTNPRSERPRGFPSVGDGAVLFPNAVVVGDVSIGAGAVVGASSFVSADVAPHTTVTGVHTARHSAM